MKPLQGKIMLDLTHMLSGPYGTMLLTDLATQQASLLQHGQAGTHGALGIVFPGLVGTEGGEQAVAGVLQHLALLLLHDAGEALQRTIHHGMDVLGVQALGKAGRPDDVQKQHADLAQHLLWGRNRGQSGQPGPKRQERRIDHRIAQQGALGFEPGDDGFELLVR